METRKDIIHKLCLLGWGEKTSKLQDSDVIGTAGFTLIAICTPSILHLKSAFNPFIKNIYPLSCNIYFIIYFLHVSMHLVDFDITGLLFLLLLLFQQSIDQKFHKLLVDK